MLVQGLHTEKPILIQKGSRNGVVRMWKALVKGRMLWVSAHACSVLLRGPIQKTDCLEQQWSSLMPSFTTKSSVDAAGRHKRLHQEPEQEAAQ